MQTSWVTTLAIVLFLPIACRQTTVQSEKQVSASSEAVVSGAASADDTASDSRPFPTDSSAPESASTKSETGNETGNQQVNQLTAGEFNDALNIDIFLRFLESDQQLLNFPGTTLRRDMTKQDWLALVPPVSTTAFNKIEIALIIDVTGSMGDELRYLQAEWDALIGDLKILYPDLAVKLSLVAYRDQGDSFVTASYGFTEDRLAFQTELKKYVAGGGGDYPEAADQALANAQDFIWGDATSAKLLFWLADAPPHAADEAKAFEAILGLRTKGVTLYPIAASGVASQAEKIMRIGALITGGSYLFLTDDSGIGGKHAEPHVPCYNVEPLNRLLQRVIAERITGQKIIPAAESIVRKVGNMQNGVCQAQN